MHFCLQKSYLVRANFHTKAHKDFLSLHTMPNSQQDDFNTLAVVEWPYADSVKRAASFSKTDSVSYSKISSVVGDVSSAKDSKRDAPTPVNFMEKEVIKMIEGWGSCQTSEIACADETTNAKDIAESDSVFEPNRKLRSQAPPAKFTRSSRRTTDRGAPTKDRERFQVIKPP